MVSVNTIQAGTVFAWFMLILLLRRIILITILAVVGSKQPLPPSRVPEDKIFRNGTVAAPTTDAARIVYTADVRANKIITNDSENDTYFLILLLATAVFSDSANGNCVRTIVYGSVYLFVRILYAVVYLMGLQPWRTLVFMLGFFCTAACNLDLIITMSGRSN